MVKTKLALIFDSLFISFLISLTATVWIKRLIKNANLFYFFLILILLLSFIIIFILLLKRNDKKLFKNNHEKFLKDSLQFLIISNNNFYNNFLSSLIKCTHVQNFLFQKGNDFLYINLKTPLSAQDYFQAQELFLEHKKESSNLYFIYNIKDKSFDDVFIFSSLNAKLFASDIILKLMKEKNYFPVIKEEKQKLGFKKKLLNYAKSKSSSITKSHFKEFLFSGLSLVVLSLIAPFSTLYLIIGTILISLSIISIFKKDIIPKETDSDFLFN